MGFGAKVEAWSNPVVATPQPRPSCQETSHNHDAFLPLAQCGCLQKGGPLLPSWPTVPATSAQTVFFYYYLLYNLESNSARTYM